MVHVHVRHRRLATNKHDHPSADIWRAIAPLVCCRYPCNTCRPCKPGPRQARFLAQGETKCCRDCLRQLKRKQLGCSRRYPAPVADDILAATQASEIMDARYCYCYCYCDKSSLVYVMRNAQVVAVSVPPYIPVYRYVSAVDTHM